MPSDHNRTDDQTRRECCRDEAFQRLLDYGIDGLGDFNFNTELNWWLGWARRRESQISGDLIDVMNAAAIEKFNTVDEIQSWLMLMCQRYLGRRPEKRPEPRGKDAVFDEE